jgi:DNA-3-methyladenine glycosylase
MKPLPSDFYRRDVVEVARDLLGCVIESRVGGVLTTGRIVEVEAYLGEHDPAAHCYGGRRTERTAPMYGPPGTAYIYFTYGMHWCMNAVTGPTGEASAVLIRALEPLEGMQAMERRRQTRKRTLLCSGPAKLCRSLGVTGRLNGHVLRHSPLRIRGPAAQPVKLGTSPRIGISRAADWPLRFFQSDSPWLSRPSSRRQAISDFR